MTESPSSPRIVTSPARGYYLNNTPLQIGEGIELWTSFGWECGRFGWKGEAHVPYLDQSPPGTFFIPGKHDAILITEGMLCRRLDIAAQEPVRPIEFRVGQ
jgi:hypothetical protein